jgi:hypothetical protein
VRPCKGVEDKRPKRNLQIWCKWSDWDILRLVGKLFEWGVRIFALRTVLDLIQAPKISREGQKASPRM